jgi:hypothetical protein
MENIAKQEIEWDEDNEKQEDPVEDQDDEICIATKTNGDPCCGLKYKDNDYCYSHLTKMKMLPKPNPKTSIELPKRGRPKKVQPAVSQPVSQPAVSQPQPAVSSLEDKLMKRMKDKLKGLDADTKLLLQCLL